MFSEIRRGHLSVIALACGVWLTSPVGALAQSAATGAVPNCQKYEELALKGAELIDTPICDRIDPGLGGIREALYKYGIGVSLVGTQGTSYDLRSSGVPRGEPPSYTGQRPEFTTDNYMITTYDLARLGFQQGAQFTFSVGADYSTWDQYGVTGFYIPQLSAIFPFFDDHVTVQVGYTVFQSMFMGSSLTTSQAGSALGNTSSIPILLGVTQTKPAPGVDIRILSPDKRFYNHFGVQRSANPDGFDVDWKTNKTSLDWSVPNAGAIFINEVGYRVQSAPGELALWMRGGAVYNESRFKLVDDPDRTAHNAGFYLIGDWQLNQPDKDKPWTGWFLGAKFDKAREDVSSFKMDYGLTLYNVGPFPSRSNDVFAVGFTRSFVSDRLVRSLQNAGARVSDTATSANVAYIAELAKGIFLGTTLSYTDHPTITPVRKPALNLIFNLSQNF